MNKRLALLLVILPTLTLIAIAYIDAHFHHYENVKIHCANGVCSPDRSL